MIRKFVQFFAVAGAALLLTACGSGITQDISTADSGGSSAVIPNLDEASGVNNGTTSTPAQEVIRNGDMTLKVNDVSKSFDDVKALVVSKSGRIESSSFNTESDYSGPTAYIVARIPEARLDEVIAAVSDLGQRTSLNLNTTDVTLQTVDLKARIAALIISRDRLLALMAKATTTADLLAAEQALAQRQGELDAYQSQLDYLKSQVAQSTLNIQVLGDSTSITSGLMGIRATLTQALRNFLQAFENVVLFIGSAIPWVLIFIICYFPIRSFSRWLQKKTSKKSAKS